MENLNLDVLGGKEVKKLIALNVKIAKTKKAIEDIQKNLELQADALVNKIQNKLAMENPDYCFVEDLSDEQRDRFICTKRENQCSQKDGFIALHIEHGILS